MKDKEKQICKYCGKPIKSSETKTIKERIADYDGNYFCSCDKEKQIEEMFNYLRECSNNAWAKGFDYAEIDNEKLRAFLDLFLKDSVVLSREEKDKTDKYITDLCSMIDNLRDDSKKASKETAEKFAKDLLAVWDDLEKWSEKYYEPHSGITPAHIKEYAKQFGVEIKEN